MSRRHRTRANSPTTKAARFAVAGVAVCLGGLALAGQANADPMDPANPAPLPGQPVLVDDGAMPPPVPGDAPPNFNPSQAVGRVPDNQAHYGSGSGPLGFLRDAYSQAKDPYNFGGTPPGEMPMSSPPPGAGPAPQLPPGYVSLNAPGSEAPAVASGPPANHPALPPGYYSTSGPPPPGYLDPAAPPPALSVGPADGAAPPAALSAGPPPPPSNVYVPVHSPPPPPLYPEGN